MRAVARAAARRTRDAAEAEGSCPWRRAHASSFSSGRRGSEPDGASCATAAARRGSWDVGFLAPDPDEEPPLLLQRHLAAWPTHGGSGAAIAAVGPRPLIALYDFTPEAPGELLMERGMWLELCVCQAAGAGWCVVRDGSGASGLVPLSFVGRRRRRRAAGAAVGGTARWTRMRRARRAGDGRSVRGDARFCRRGGGEMSVAAGTRLQIIEGGGTSGWCIARTADGHRGLVPFSFLTEDRPVAASSSTSYEAQREPRHRRRRRRCS